MTSSDPILLTGDWVTPRYIAAHAGCSIRHVRRWCEKGYLTNLGMTVIQDRVGRWWIKMPPTVNLSRLRNRPSFPSQALSSVA